jgi:hypothetical protein|tara:strand:- start:983 stop:1945 length:963 start_codon:yes stop_codon:yes gene_type:complete
VEIKIEIEELRTRKLFLATPMYGGMCAGMYCKSTNDLAALCMHYGIELKMYYLFNESLITRARNYCCDEFMRSDCTHMLFIDADIGFEANDVISMLALMDQDKDDGMDILCSPYPKKCIAWEKIKAAVDQGQADDDPNILDNFVGDYVFNPVPGTTEIKLDEPAEVLEGGTGFMMFTKKSLQKFKDAYWDDSEFSPGGFRYKPDHVRTEHFDGTREIMMYFQALIDPDSRRYLSEDYMFCQWARKVGLRIWLCPWVKLSHVGSFVYGGSLQALAAIGASATADTSKIGGKMTSPISELEKKQKKADGANKKIKKSKNASV